MKYYIFWLLFVLLLPTLTMAMDFFKVDDESPWLGSMYKGLTVHTPVAHYYPVDTESALYKVLKQAQILTAHTSFMGRDGIPYKQHAWRGRNDRANLKKGIDCSRAIWFAFTRANIPYNPKNRYLATVNMWRKNSQMRHHFRRCSINDLRLGDVLVYRGGGAGHTVMVLDPKKKLAWGSHGWDKSGRKDTGVEVQQVVSKNGWSSWDRSRMKLKACWRHQDFTNPPKPRKFKPKKLMFSELGQYPETHSRYLSDADLLDKTRYILWLMRNEMFARYGYRFKNQDLAGHFQQQFWYRATDLSSHTILSQFSEIERANMQLIGQYEQNQQVEKNNTVSELTTDEQSQPVSHLISNEQNQPVSELAAEKQSQPVSHLISDEKNQPVSKLTAEKQSQPVSNLISEEQSQPVNNLTPLIHQPKPVKPVEIDEYLAGTRRLTPADIAGKSKQALRLMRNEIYARHGYRFGKHDLQEYFSSKPWYQPSTTNGSDLYNHAFSQIERDNVNFIRRAESD